MGIDLKEIDLKVSGVDHIGGEGVWLGFFIFITILFILFVGTPDIHDAIMYKLFDGNITVQSLIVDGCVIK